MPYKKWLKKLAGVKDPAPAILPEVSTETPMPKTKKPRAKKVEPVVVDPNLVAKANATAAGEPWVTVLNVEIDKDHISNGAFELDWNDFFIAKLVRAGYKGTDIEMVDQWFADICRNVIQENWEQDQADPDNRK